MSTIKVVPDNSWLLPTFAAEPLTSSTDYPNVDIQHEEYIYLFCIFVSIGFFLWTFKKQV